jgi:hypothetical protein
MSNLMTAVLTAVAVKIIDPLIKKLFAALWKRLMTNEFRARLKATMRAYLPIVASLCFTVVVGLNIWVYSRPAHPSGVEILWLFVYLLELVLSMFLIAFSFARLSRSKRNRDGGKLLWRDRGILTHPGIPSSVFIICDKRTRCLTVFPPGNSECQ